MGEMNNYKCRACGAPLAFDPATGKLQCAFCGSSYDPGEYELEDKTGKTDQEASQWGVAEGMKAYVCPSCGAELICDKNTAATSCPYCGNNAVIPGQFTGAIQPELILPFKVTKDQAVEALQNHYKGKILLPDAFKKKNHIEKIQGVYVPFWLFDKDADGILRCDCEESDSYREGDYIVTNTRHYRVVREGSMSFEKVPVDASSRMPDDYMDSIEPFDYGEIRPFSPTYMPGFLADKYDVEKEQAVERADLRCKNSMEAALRETVTGYTGVAEQERKVNLTEKGCHYGLLPVWTLGQK